LTVLTEKRGGKTVRCAEAARIFTWRIIT
jgi:hypothetical protein